MQKVLTEMNLQLANVISDLSGVSGMAIVRAILSGERDGETLANLANRMIRASKEDIASSLQGNWREELLFLLRQEVELYDLYQQRILECDRQVAAQLRRFASKETASATTEAAPAQPKRVHKPKGNAPRFDLGTELQRITGVDLTRIDGVSVLTAQTLISEIGTDMGRWKTEAHFASWLGLCPDNRISGDKILRRGTRSVANRAATALRMAATTRLRSKTYLGAQYRRLRTRLGAPKAITAMAHNLARLVYRLLRYGQQYVDKGLDYYEQRFREQQTALLRKRAASLGFQITEIASRP
jgi:transposase